MEPREMLALAFDTAAQRIRNVSADDLAKQTPCSEWDVRGLINHMIEANKMFAAVGSGRAPEFGTDFGDDPVSAYDESAAAAREAWGASDALERTWAMPFGEFPGIAAITLNTLDQTLHAWDLAKATGQDQSLPAELCEAGLQVLSNMPDEFRGEGRPFGHKVDCPDDAPIEQRLAALSGRTP